MIGFVFGIIIILLELIDIFLVWEICFVMIFCNFNKFVVGV